MPPSRGVILASTTAAMAVDPRCHYVETSLKLDGARISERLKLKHIIQEEAASALPEGQKGPNIHASSGVSSAESRWGRETHDIDAQELLLCNIHACLAISWSEPSWCLGGACCRSVPRQSSISNGSCSRQGY